MRHWIASIFRPPTMLDVLTVQLETCEVSLEKHEQAVNYSAALVVYNRTEIARLKQRIAERMQEGKP